MKIVSETDSYTKIRIFIFKLIVFSLFRYQQIVHHQPDKRHPFATSVCYRTPNALPRHVQNYLVVLMAQLTVAMIKNYLHLKLFLKKIGLICSILFLSLKFNKVSDIYKYNINIDHAARCIIHDPSNLSPRYLI